MALSPSPQLSPVMTTQHRIERPRSESPPAQPLSKRDKRRMMLLERLQEITADFSSNKDSYYRQQLQAIQLDTTMILQSRPYAEDPITELDPDLESMLLKASSDNAAGIAFAVQKNDLSALGGRLYAEYANEIRDAMEERDAALTAHQYEHDKKMIDLNTSNTFLTKLAEEEHKALADQLRNRLINSVTGRKLKLNKDKDIESIAETNALLMHPNQFTITNPSSPGGVLGKRATRHRRDVDDLPGMIDPHKRKRRAIEDTGSPAPNRGRENGSSTPMWSTEQIARATNKGNEDPLYTIDKLFTEKELTMTYNQAAMAAHKYIVTHRYHQPGSVNGSDEDSSAEAEVGEEMDMEGHESPPSAPAMDRQFSHATRSTRGAAGLTGSYPLNSYITPNGIEVFADLDVPRSFLRMSAQLPKMPPPLSLLMNKPYTKEGANSPMGVAGEDLAADFARIEECKKVNELNGPGRSLDADRAIDRAMLKRAVEQLGVWPVWLPNEKKEPEARNGKRQALTSNLRAEDAMGGVPMSKQSSMGGSEMGGTPMSRNVTNDGSRRKRY